MRLIDQFTDDRHAMLTQLHREHPGQLERVKTASVDDPGLPDNAFAYPEARRFPINSAEQTLLSKMYATKQASSVPKTVMDRIDRALSLYDVDVTDITTQSEKTASDEEQAPDSSHFLLPQYRSLLVKEASHIAPAAEALLAQRNKLTTRTITQAATELVKRAAKFDVDADSIPHEIFKYAGLTSCDAGKLLDWVEARMTAAPTSELQQDYEKVAQYLENKFPRGGVFYDRGDLIKLAEILETLDTKAEFFPRYGRTLLDPVETVFNMDKIAEPMVSLSGQQVSLKKLMQIPSEVFEEILGEDVTQHAMADGQIDAAQFKAMLETLPADLQSLLATHIKAYL